MNILNLRTELSWLNVMALAMMILLGACAEDNISEENAQVLLLPQSQELVEATLTGQVISESGIGIPGAVVKLKSGLQPVEVLTDEGGYFLIPNVRNKGFAGFLTITYPGKFDAFRKYSLVPSRYNYTEIKMTDRESTGTINAAQGGTLNQPNGASITLPKDGMVSADGQPYSGQVDVAMTWIDPSADDLVQRMIGDLSGIDEVGNYRSLASYGMLQVELSDPDGNELNLSQDASAQLVFPIPSSMLTAATSTIPLWSYNEDIGTWIQEGTAVKEGNSYVASVEHFSSWNVDHMTDPIEITGQIFISNEQGDEVGGSYLKVYVCSEEIGRKGGWLCDDGSFRFYNFPKDEVFKLKVLDRCGDEIYKETYGPFSEDTDLGEIKVGVRSEFIKVFGNAIDCNGDILKDGVLNVFRGDEKLRFPIDDKGQFEFSLDFCNDEPAILEIYDLSNLLFGGAKIYPDQPVVELSNIEICNDIDDFISITEEGKEPVVFSPSEGAEITKKEINGEVKFIVELQFQEFDIQTINDSLGAPGFFLVVETTGNISEVADVLIFRFTTASMKCGTLFELGEIEVVFTHFDFEPGGYIEGTFIAKGIGCFEGNTQDSIEKNFEGFFKVPIR